MKLSDYLSEREIQRNDFARSVGVSPGWITSLCDGSKQPSLELAEKIALATGGAVMPNDFIDFTAPANGEAA